MTVIIENNKYWWNEVCTIIISTTTTTIQQLTCCCESRDDNKPDLTLDSSGSKVTNLMPPVWEGEGSRTNKLIPVERKAWKWRDGWMDEWTNKWIYERNDKQMDEWSYEWIDKWFNELIGDWMDGWMDGWKDELTTDISPPFLQTSMNLNCLSKCFNSLKLVRLTWINLSELTGYINYILDVFHFVLNIRYFRERKKYCRSSYKKNITVLN